MKSFSLRLANAAAASATAVPSTHTIRDVLDTSLKHVPENGFTTGALDAAINDLSRGRSTTAEVLQAMSAAAFTRGAPVAIMEHAVQQSNTALRSHLLQIIEKHSQAERALNGSSATAAGSSSNIVSSSPIDVDSMESEADVVYEGLKAKLGALAPVVHHWPQAVHLEACPSNAPFAIKNLAEMSDDIAYFAERQRKLRALLAAGGAALRSSNIHSPEAAELFVKTILNSAPLSSGPQDGLEWYTLRAKISAVYGITITNMIGESTGVELGDSAAYGVACYPESMALLRKQVDALW